MRFWNEIITRKSYNLLQKIINTYDVTLIGEWGVWVHTRKQESFEIEIIVNPETLMEIRKDYVLGYKEKQRVFGFQISVTPVTIYVTYHSKLIIPPEEIIENYLTKIDNYKVPTPEVLLLLHQEKEMKEKNKIIKTKYRIDILTLLDIINPTKYRKILPNNKYIQHLTNIILNSNEEWKYLDIVNPTEIKQKKKELLDKINNII